MQLGDATAHQLGRGVGHFDAVHCQDGGAGDQDDARLGKRGSTLWPALHITQVRRQPLLEPAPLDPEHLAARDAGSSAGATSPSQRSG